METDGTTRVFHLRNDEQAQYAREIHPIDGVEANDQRTIQGIESRVDIRCVTISTSQQEWWKILTLAPWLKAKNIRGLSEGLEISVPPGTSWRDKYGVMAEVFDKLLQPRGLGRLMGSGDKPGLTIVVG